MKISTPLIARATYVISKSAKSEARKAESAYENNDFYKAGIASSTKNYLYSIKSKILQNFNVVEIHIIENQYYALVEIGNKKFHAPIEKSELLNSCTLAVKHIKNFNSTQNTNGEMMSLERALKIADLYLNPIGNAEVKRRLLIKRQAKLNKAIDKLIYHPEMRLHKRIKELEIIEKNL